jgi:hypothetical protein
MRLAQNPPGVTIEPPGRPGAGKSMLPTKPALRGAGQLPNTEVGMENRSPPGAYPSLISTIVSKGGVEGTEDFPVPPPQRATARSIGGPDTDNDAPISGPEYSPGRTASSRTDVITPLDSQASVSTRSSFGSANPTKRSKNKDVAAGLRMTTSIVVSEAFLEPEFEKKKSWVRRHIVTAVKNIMKEARE